MIEGECEERQLLVDQMGTSVINMELSENNSGSSSPVNNGGIGSVSFNTLNNNNENNNEAKFLELLKRSKSEDLSSVADSGCIYQSGTDSQGRPIIVFIGKWFRQSKFDLEKAVMFLLKVVEPISDSDYVVVYFHSKTTRDNIPSYGWIKDVYNTLSYRYKKNLKAFYIVHPTMWTKLTCWWFSTFMAPAIKNKIQNIHCLTELTPVLDTKELDLPMFITEHDMSLNGLRFYQP